MDRLVCPFDGTDVSRPRVDQGPSETLLNGSSRVGRERARQEGYKCKERTILEREDPEKKAPEPVPRSLRKQIRSSTSLCPLCSSVKRDETELEVGVGERV